MKIALFHNLPSGGAKRALFEHTRGLQQRGHVLDVYLMETANETFLPLSPLCDQVYRYSTPSVQMPLLEKRLLNHAVTRPFWKLVGEKFYQELLTYRNFRHEIRKLDALDGVYEQMAYDIDARGYDLVYVHHCKQLLSPSLLRYLSTPSVYFCQDTLRPMYEWSPPGHEPPDFDSRPESLFVRKARGRFLPIQQVWFERIKEQRNTHNARAATLVLANSWYSREAILRTSGISAHVCYLGVDAHLFSPDPTVERENVVLSIGGLGPHKQHDFVIDCVARFPLGRRPRMRIIGNDSSNPDFGKRELGPFGKWLLARAEEKGVDLVISQEVTDEALRDGYRRAGVLAYATYLEPFGFVALEAMACETPIVGVSEGGLRESIVPGITGLLTHRDEREFSEALDRLLTDPDLATDLGRNGRRRTLDLWNWERSLDTLENLFALALERKHKADGNRSEVDGSSESGIGYESADKRPAVV